MLAACVYSERPDLPPMKGRCFIACSDYIIFSLMTLLMSDERNVIFAHHLTPPCHLLLCLTLVSLILYVGSVLLPFPFSWPLSPRDG